MMQNPEISSLINELNSNTPQTIQKLEVLIGTNKSLTTSLLTHLTSQRNTPAYLPMCALLLLEHPQATIPVIRSILKEYPSSIPSFIFQLEKSSFYVQRKAIPAILINLGYADTRKVLHKLISDPIVLVVKSVVDSLCEYRVCPFTDDELVELAMCLNNHQSEFVQCCVADLLTLINQKVFLVTEICMSDSWRKRYSLAKVCKKLKMEDRINLFNILSKDIEDDIRICLAKNIDVIIEHKDIVQVFIKDSNPSVRALAVQKIGNIEGYFEMLKEISSDPSWEVRKELLNIQRCETYKTVSLPLINSLFETLNWRVRKEVLDSVEQISKNNEELIRNYLSEHLIKSLKDKVCEIRKEAARIITSLVEMYEWTGEWSSGIEEVVKSKNYLHRISVAPVAVMFDRKFGTNFVAMLLNDKVDNVKQFAMENMTFESLNETTRSILEELSACDDVDIQRIAKKLLENNKQ